MFGFTAVASSKKKRMWDPHDSRPLISSLFFPSHTAGWRGREAARRGDGVGAARLSLGGGVGSAADGTSAAPEGGGVRIPL